MALIRNAGGDRVVDRLRKVLQDLESAGADVRSAIDIVTSDLSLFAFDELRDLLNRIDHTRLLLSFDHDRVAGLLGVDGDRHYRNRLESRRIARQCLEWLNRRADVRDPVESLPPRNRRCVPR